MLCRVADDPVVVLNSRPEKPGNSVEDKTERTDAACASGLTEKPKAPSVAKG